MSPNTKVKVKYLRWIQLFFRICALVGAIGTLICVICIKGTQGTEGWIIRVPVRLSTILLQVTLLINVQSLALLLGIPCMQSIILQDQLKFVRQHLQPAT